ncbi:glucose-1-phosphate cytidylyltransferase [Phaeobacter sp.]|uniref:glucose-1-phosphate cytidylyltransferase n=1 Tax=Phaeobacter sp. TaxID=1902409 RepID=UPI0025D1A203|nr:glucose-1-phosphate cytidylyltransferase [Phaeobacter sp.]
MKVVILAGGLGTRISEESHLRPKPMIEIGGKPILWHIMKAYGEQGFTDFVICCGYKGYMIKEYFANYMLHNSDICLDMRSGEMAMLQKNCEPWKVTLLDTGETTQTGGRLAQVRQYLDETFCLTYGDGVANVDLSKLVQFHRDQGTKATVTAVQPVGRFGSIEMQGNRATRFVEKPAGDGNWVSGGFFVLEPSALDHISGPDTVWEQEPIERLAAQQELSVYKHHGFWAAMDTQRDKLHLERLWAAGEAPWKIWS